jgi:hypothetical protein
LKLKTIICSVLLSLFTYSLVAQSGYFQLREEYTIKTKKHWLTLASRFLKETIVLEKAKPLKKEFLVYDLS